MEFQRQTNRRLYEEHVATLQLLARVERVYTGRAGAYPPAAGDPAWPAFARALLTAIEVEVARHFEFEERDLFPLLEEAGDGDLAALLNEEHVTIRAVAQPLAGLLRQALASGLQAQQWQAMKTLALEFSERLGSHAQKEDGALLPLLDNLLDEDTDRELFGGYAAG
jgi:iron-sulfur cluster repair protein YtfE (RIC family)